VSDHSAHAGTHHCSACGARARRAVPDGDNRLRDVCPRCGKIDYKNPRVVVGSVCSWRDRLLICRRSIEPRRGFWTIPAGYLEFGEAAEQGAMREAMEEANASIRIETLLAVYSLARIGEVQLLYRAQLLDDRISAGPESVEVALVTWDAIPWNDLAFPSVHWVLRHALSIKDQAGPHMPVGVPTDNDARAAALPAGL